MGISLGDLQADCLSSLRFPKDVLLFSTSLKQLKKMMSDFTKEAPKKWGWRFIRTKRKFSATKDPTGKRK